MWEWEGYSDLVSKELQEEDILVQETEGELDREGHGYDENNFTHVWDYQKITPLKEYI